MSLSTTARDILVKAAQQPDLIATLPARLPIAAQRTLVQSMLKHGLLEEAVARDDDQPAWRTAETGLRYVLRATEAGTRAVNIAPTQFRQDRLDPVASDPCSHAGQRAPSSTGAGQEPITVVVAAPPALSLRTAAQAVLRAWDDIDPDRPALPHAVEMLRAALPQRSSSPQSSAPRQHRANTKRAAILA